MWYRDMFIVVGSTLNLIERASPVPRGPEDPTAAWACHVAERLWRTARRMHTEASYGNKHKPPGITVVSSSLRTFLESVVLPSATVIYASALVEVRSDAEAFELVEGICKEDGANVCCNMAALYARAGRHDEADRWMSHAIELDPAYEVSAHTDPSAANLYPAPPPAAARINL
jgi:hypothetical protein